MTDVLRTVPNEEQPSPGWGEPGRRNGTTKRAPTVIYDTTAEDAVIRACLYADKATVANATNTGLLAKHFQSVNNGHIWAAIVDVTEAGHLADITTVADQLARNHITGIGPAVLAQYDVDAPLVYRSNIARYAEIIIGHSTSRAAAGAIARAAEELDLGGDPHTVISRIADRIPKPVGTTDEYVELDDFLDDDEPDHDWIIPGLLEHGDRTIITARAGTGKTTFQRQLGVMAASGLHPFTTEEIDPTHVLFLDTENSRRQSRRKFRELRRHATDYARGYFHLRVYGHSINLADHNTRLELCRTVERLQPGIILAGPLYKLAEGDPKDEQVAKAVADSLDELRAICGSALSIEAHSPYPVPGSKAKPTIRPYGASLWERWPEFGWFLGEDGKIEHWRGQRDERDWPTALERSTPWPWLPAEPTGFDKPAWDGPTHCIEAIVHYLNTHPDEELSGSQLEVVLRATGNGYRTKTVLEAAERAAGDGQIALRIGPRKARLYSHISTPKLEPNDEPF